MTTVYAIIDSFDEHLAAAKVATNTRRAYCLDVQAFLEYCRFEGDVDSITYPAVERYLQHLKEQGNKVSTINRKISSINALVKYLKAIDLFSYNQLSAIPLQQNKKPRKYPEILSSQQIDTLFAAIDTGTAKGLRDRTMIELLYASGIPVKDLLQLQLTQLDIPRALITIYGAQGPRQIPLYKGFLATLEQYLQQVRPQLMCTAPKSQLVFANLKGGPISRQGFCKLFHGYVEKAGLGPYITPKTLRQSFTVHLLEDGAPLKHVQELSGHLAHSTTEFYQRVLQNEAKTSYKIHHPKFKKRPLKKGEV
ncbi:tyrosine-type recombinase/integrase [Neobittarella massiliensis]|uniref:Tyrosine-type recombinase/integrase n=1 Tax=Neobittarella massiliensis (ex Bilen et al. 2018) TaxID=2041842 RepID=A0A8J6LYK6_9FIRM|nr:tyrosine-type recombinase/integrase [Neobittarella massiliensis]